MAAWGEDNDDLPSFQSGGKARFTEGYAIPQPPVAGDKVRWLSFEKSFDIAGFHVRKGFVYLGSVDMASSERSDPTLIDPRMQVASSGLPPATQVVYSPSYSELSPIMRRGYLQWLADGRSAPDANMTFVFLYFYGLERRIILDILRDGEGTSEFPDLYKELKRLYVLYSAVWPSFKRHCAQLIELVEVAASEEKLYERPLDAFPSKWGFPFLIRLAVGQAVRDRVPISGEIALTWAEHDPAVVRRASVTRCSAEFRKLFLTTYSVMHGHGLVFAPNKTKLKLVYEPASSIFFASGGVNMHFGDIPDISALTAPVKRIQEVVDACASALDSFSRYLSRNPHGRARFEGVLHLPVALWPDTTRSILEAMRAGLQNKVQRMKLGELVALFGGRGGIGLDQQRILFGTLKVEGVGSEPDVANTPRALAVTDQIVLFAFESGAYESMSEAANTVARLSVELASAVAHADGTFCDRELAHLLTSIRRWEHLSVSARARLEAYAHFLQTSSPGMSSLKKKIDTLDIEMRHAVAAFAASMVLADDVASVEEVKLLEKIYQLLGIERAKAYGAIHARKGTLTHSTQASHGGQNSSPTHFSLDAAKIAVLTASSQQIAARLASIFDQEPEPIPVLMPVAEESSEPTAVMGLDPAHSAFARLLTSRGSWQRAELIDVAADLAIMLDGALERLNEASLDAHDMAFTEDGDPIEINPEIMEKLAQ